MGNKTQLILTFLQKIFHFELPSTSDKSNGEKIFYNINGSIYSFNGENIIKEDITFPTTDNKNNAINKNYFGPNMMIGQTKDKTYFNYNGTIFSFNGKTFEEKKNVKLPEEVSANNLNSRSLLGTFSK